MAKNVETPSDIRIASLEVKRTQEVHNLTQPGSGTPWEDRGSQGTFVAFFKTAFASMFRPVSLTRAIRRPETTSDATAFVVGCGIAWGISAAIHNYILLKWRYELMKHTAVDYQTYFLGSALQSIGCIVLTWLFLKIFAQLFDRLTSMDRRGKAPPLLIYNVFAYGMGPSVLAVIPIVGPVLALVWIFFTLNLIGAKRLQVTISGAIIASILSFLGCAAIGMAIYFGGWFAWDKITSGAINDTTNNKNYDY